MAKMLCWKLLDLGLINQIVLRITEQQGSLFGSSRRSLLLRAECCVPPGSPRNEKGWFRKSLAVRVI